MSVADELDKLQKMHEDGTITDEQYERARKKLLDKEPEGGEEEAEGSEDRRPRRRRERDEEDEDEDDEAYALRRRRARRKQVREWSMILHLSLFAGHAVPFGGIIAPIVIWQTKKDEMPELDEHGKNAVNWVISFIIYAVISGLLCFVLVGFVLLPIVLILNIVFPVIAAVKANEGQVWRYPLAIPFLR